MIYDLSNTECCEVERHDTKAWEIKKKLEEKGKRCFIFVFDTLDANEMENFPFIDFWVNTACPRIADDKDKNNVIDMGELDNLTKN